MIHAYDDSLLPPPGEGSSQRPQEHELDAQWRAFLFVAVAGWFLGILFITGPLCWIQGRRIRKGYQALSVPVAQGASVVEWLGVLSCAAVALALPFIIGYLL
ncbi:MAG: hypothetical protein AB1Z98_22430 [Nannocystaceae bacterium]